MAINLKQKKGQQPKQENYNKSLTTYPTSGSGEGYTSIGNNYNSAWGGSFQIGGSLPGATGYMYARHGAPDNGKYAKKTKASAKNGKEMLYYQNGLDYLPKSMPDGGGIPVKPLINYTPNGDISSKIKLSPIQTQQQMYQNAQDNKKLKTGGVIEDDRGQWQHPGKVTKINSNNITMKNVPYPVIGISNTGHTQMMYPEQDYKFHGNSVIEYPLLESGGSIQDKGQLQQLDDLTNFTNYNNMKKAQIGARMQATDEQQHMSKYKPLDVSDFMAPKPQPVQQQAAPSGGGGFDLGSIMKLAGGSGGDAGSMADIGSALAKYGGSFNDKKGKFDVKKLNKVLARNGYEIKKFDGGGLLGPEPETTTYETTLSPDQQRYEQETGNKYNSATGDKQIAGMDYSNYGATTDKQNSLFNLSQKQSNWDKISGGINDADKALGPIGGVAGAIGTASNIINDINRIGDEKKAANKEHGVSSAVTAAMLSRSERAKAKYVEPKDAPVQQEELNRSGGVGTNYLAANGTNIPGNPSEISNTYAPNNIYTDSGYEPLHDSDNIKKFQYGGSKQLGSDIGGGLGQVAGTLLGGPMGGVVGKIGGEFLGGAIGSAFGSDRGLTERKRLDDMKFQDAAFSQQGSGFMAQNSAYSKNGGNFDKQGWMNPNYNPQVITKFDGHDVRTTQMHQMRSGGHISQEYVEPHESSYMAAGGELQTHWGGKAEPISYNPYLPEGGETVMFKGASHKDGGIGVTYGNNPVEVQGGEPATKLQDGGNGGNNLVVFGGMKISPPAAKEIGDEKAIGKKYQTYATEISKNEAKASKTLNDASELINNHTSSDAFSQLAFSSGQAKMIGAQMQLKNAAQRKQAAGIVQNAILDTADEHGLVADKLAENKIVPMTNKELKAKWGKTIAKAQIGVSLPPEQRIDNNNNVSVYDKQSGQYIPLEEYNASQQGNFKFNPYQVPQSTNNQTNSLQNQQQIIQTNVEGNQDNTQYTIHGDKNHIDYTPTNANKNPLFSKKNYKTQWIPKVEKSFSDPNTAKQLIDRLENYSGVSADVVKKQLAGAKTFEEKIKIAKKLAEDGKPGPYHQIVNNFIDAIPEKTSTVEQKKAPIYQGKKDEVVPTTTTEQTTQKGPGLEKYLPILNPLLRHKYSANLDPDQLMGERYSLLSNQVDPVKAQGYQPLLQSPYDISYQDQLNANQSDFNAMQRQVGNNPAALASLAAQKYGANEKVLGEQFRQNQAEHAKVYGENRNTLNDAQLKNLGIYDQQYTRQEQAKSNTKSQAINALTSIGDKIAQSRRDANEMNMYSALNPNFYVDSSGTFHNQGFASLNMQGNNQQSGVQGLAAAKEMVRLNNEDLKRIGQSLPQYSSVDQRYETDAQAKGKAKFGKKIPSRNSNIVKAIKNTKLYK